MYLFLHSPVSLFSSITSFLPYAGVDNSRLPSLSQEPLPCPEVALLQTAPLCSAWIRQCFRGQQISRPLSFLFWPTFPFSHSLTLAPTILLPLLLCHWCPQLLLPPVLSFSSLPWVGGINPPSSPHHGLPAPRFSTITWGPEVWWFLLSWVLISTQKTW